MIGTLFVVAAPSGAGKTSLVRRLIENDPDALRVSVSYTTRAPRPGEIDGVHYRFTNPDHFQSMIRADQLLEHALVHGHYYGTGRDQVEAAFAEHIDMVLEIDWQGARQVRERYPDCVSIFVLPPSREELLRRLNQRGQDAPDVIARRMRNARGEMAHATEFDYLIVNDNFEMALAQLAAIVRAARVSMRVQAPRQQALLAQLLMEST